MQISSHACQKGREDERGEPHMASASHHIAIRVIGVPCGSSRLQRMVGFLF